jgi:hypothetical protein
MRNMLAILAAFGLLGTGGAWAQEGEKKVEGKQEGGGEKKPAEKEGGGVPVKKGEPGVEPSLTVQEVDANGDGRISASELKAALGKLGGGGGEKKSIKKPAPDGGAKKVAPKEGDGEKKPAPEGDGVKKAPPKEGDGEKKAPAKEGGDKEGEKK